MTVRAISYGGGVQSTAMLVLAAAGQIDCDLAIFANVGDHAENPETLDYVHRWAMPFCAQHGIELTECNRGGKWPDLYDRLTHPASRFLGIPIYLPPGGGHGNRSCTRDYKIVVIGRELKRRGATRDNPADVLIGISADEASRANNRRGEPHERVHYPLLDMRLSRLDCARVIADAGLPVPPKSACWFCPFHNRQQWMRQRTERPDLFERTAQLEEHLNAKRSAQGRDQVFICNAMIPIRRAIPDMDTLPFDEPDPADGECDSGWCMT